MRDEQAAVVRPRDGEGGQERVGDSGTTIRSGWATDPGGDVVRQHAGGDHRGVRLARQLRRCNASR
ncbi:MAG: hypothetical protein U0470_10135 [Anaerolineae bacterium]